MKIGIAELIVVLIVALIFVGPEKLPYYARRLGKAFADFRRASNEAASGFSENFKEPPENRTASPAGRKEKECTVRADRDYHKNGTENR